MALVGANLFGSQILWRAVEIPCKGRNLLGVGLLRVLCEIAMLMSSSIRWRSGVMTVLLINKSMSCCEQHLHRFTIGVPRNHAALDAGVGTIRLPRQRFSAMSKRSGYGNPLSAITVHGAMILELTRMIDPARTTPGATDEAKIAAMKLRLCIIPSPTLHESDRC